MHNIIQYSSIKRHSLSFHGQDWVLFDMVMGNVVPKFCYWEQNYVWYKYSILNNESNDYFTALL